MIIQTPYTNEINIFWHYHCDYQNHLAQTATRLLVKNPYRTAFFPLINGHHEKQIQKEV